MHVPLTMKEHFFNDSPKLSIWMLVGYQGHFKYTLRVVIAIKPMPKGEVSTITIGTPIAFGSFGQFWPNNLAQFWPNLAQSWPILSLV